MIYYDKIKVIGSDSSGRSIAVVSLWVDTAAILPAANAYQSDGFILGMGSEGNCIDSGDKYRLDSSGAWQITQAGTGTYTRAEIDTLLAAKQNVLTFDTVPTQGSTNPVTSGGIWTDQQRQDALQTEDRSALVELVDNGDKNKLKNTLPSGTVKGITYTINADGSITTAAGTATGGNSNLVLSLSVPAGRYVLSGCPDGGSGTTYRAQLIDNTTSESVALVTDGTEGNEFEVVSGHDYAWRFRVQDSTSIPESTFYPMICSLAAWKISKTFQPYRPSWQEMYDMILALQ